MSSSPRTDGALEHPARWRSPAGWPLRARLVAMMIALLAVLGLAVGTTAEVYLRKTLYDQLDTRLDNALNPGRGPKIDGMAEPEFRDRPFPGAETGSIALNIASPAAVQGGIVGVYTDDQGYADNRYEPMTAAALATLAALPDDGRKTDITLDGYGDYRVVSTVLENGRTVRVVALSLRSTHDTLLQVALVTGGGVLVTVLIAGFAGYVVIRRTLQPLDRVAATATRVSELRLDRGEVELVQRVPDRDTDPRTEVGQVGAALNRMLDHVGNALEARHASETQVRQFVADASHELRTPLAAIRGYAELSRRSRTPIPHEVAHVLGRVESEAKRMTVLVEDLLLLARLDAGRPLAHDPVDLTMLVVDAVSDAHAAGPRHDWQLDLPEEPVVVVGDGARLHQVLANLLANARTHTPEGTTVTVSVAATAEEAILRVADAGPGIPADLRPHIFERFARGDSSRSRAAGSTGLGLSIVHAVVTAHRGAVSVDSSPGHTVFTVRLPLVPPVTVPSVEQLTEAARPVR